jgi:hypothetical protein
MIRRSKAEYSRDLGTLPSGGGKGGM